MKLNGLNELLIEALKEFQKNNFNYYLEFLKVCGRGNIHQFSPENQFLIYHQNKNVSLAADYNTWKKVKRNYVQGKKICIYPKNKSGLFKDYAEYVFDIADTYGKDIPHVWSIDNDVKTAYCSQYDTDTNFEESIKNLTRTYVRGKIELENNVTINDGDLFYNFVSECATKIVMERCEIRYTVDETLKSEYERIPKDQFDLFIRMAQKQIQRASNGILMDISKFVLQYQKERRLEYESEERTGQDRKEIEGYTAGEEQVRKNHNGLFGESNTWDNKIVDSRRSIGEDLRSENRRSNGNVRGNYNTNEESGEYLDNQRDNVENTRGKQNSSNSGGNNNSRSALQTDKNIWNVEEKNIKQLSLFSYMEDMINDAVEKEDNTTLEILYKGDNNKEINSYYKEDVINSILRAGTGSNHDYSRYKIFLHFYRNGLDREKNISFLKEIYKSVGIGLHINDKKICVYFDKAGLKISNSNSAKLYYQRIVSWEEIENIINKLVMEGKYLTYIEKQDALIYERNQLADDIYYFFNDAFHLPKEMIPEYMAFKNYGVPKHIDTISMLLMNKETSNQILIDMETLWSLYEEGKIEKHWNYACSYDKITNLKTYLITPIQIKQEEDSLYIPINDYITDDEIDNVLVSASADRYKFKIYELYNNNQLIEKYRDVGKLYGDSGSGTKGFNLDYNNSKGMTIVKGNLLNPDCKVTTPWKHICKRLKELISSNQYLSEKELDSYKIWKEDKDNYKNINEKFNISLEKLKNENAELLEQEESKPNFYGLTEDNYIEIDKICSKLILDNKILHGYRKGIFEVISNNTISYKKKEEFIFKFFENTEKSLFLLEDSDFAHLGESYSSSSKYGKVFRITMVPAHYIDCGRYEKRVYDLTIDKLFKYTHDYIISDLFLKIESMDHFYVTSIEKWFNSLVLEYQSNENKERKEVLNNEPYATLAESNDKKLTNILIQSYFKNEKEFNALKAIIYDVFKRKSISVENKERFLETIYTSKEDNFIRNIFIESNSFSVKPCKEVNGFNIQSLDKKVDTISFSEAAVVLQQLVDNNEYITEPELKEQIDFINDNTLRSIDWIDNIIVEYNSIINSDNIINQFNTKDVLKSINKSNEFTYTDDWEPNIGGTKDRYEKNIEAIKILKKVEKENRFATLDEQVVLSKYIGWGGLSHVFDEESDKFKDELKDILTEEEYKSAKASVTDSFYTPKVVIDTIYEAIGQFGFKGGNVLEPSMGIGNFYNGMKQDLKDNCCLYGVEVDSISGRIAQQLHPNANIQVSGIEKSTLSDNFFNIVIGNVPFGNFKVYDKRYMKHYFNS